MRILTEREKKVISHHFKSSQSFIKDRARIIHLSHDGKTVKEVCHKLGFYRSKVEKTIKEFNRIGLKVFHRGKSTGKPRRITKEQRALILQYVNTDPAELDLHFNNWSHKKLSDYAKKKGIEVSPTHVGRIIKEDKLKYKKKTSWLYSNVFHFAKKKLKIDTLKTEPPPDSVVLSFDEKAKIAIKQYSRYVYTKDKIVKHPSKQKIRGLMEMLAAINVHTCHIHYWFFDWKNSFIVIDCFKDLLKKYVN